MPTKKLRGGQGKNEKAFSLHKTMGLPGGKKGFGEPGKVDIVNQNIREGGGKKSAGKVSPASHTGYDVKTRVNVPSAKGMGKAARTQRKMKAK